MELQWFVVTGVAVPLLNLFFRNWVVALVGLFLGVGAVFATAAEPWLQWAMIICATWSFIMALDLFFRKVFR